MSERRFVFYEVGTIAPDSARGITESELKRRVEWIWLHPRASFSEITNVLLHGEGKEEVHDHIPLRGLSIEEIKRKYPEQYAQAITEAEELSKEQPDPWEEWVERMPVTLDGKLDIIDTHAFRDWFREMPRK